MIVRKPSYYEHFSCLCGDCPDSCCGCWQIVVDAGHADLYRKLEGPLGEKVRGILTEDEDGEEILSFPGKSCPLLTEEGLCGLQKNLGEAALCSVCAFYPRFRYEFGGTAELGLSISCPEVASLVLKNDFELLTEKNGAPPSLNDIRADLYFRYAEGRKKAFAIARDKTLTVKERLRSILLFSEALERGAEPEVLPSGMRKAAKSDHRKLVEIFEKMDYLREEDRAILLRETGESGIDEIAGERLLCYFIYKYFLQAAYDGKLLWRICFAAAFLLRLFDAAAQKTPEDFALLTARLSRECEHSEDNLRLFQSYFNRRKLAMLLRLLSE